MHMFIVALNVKDRATSCVSEILRRKNGTFRVILGAQFLFLHPITRTVCELEQRKRAYSALRLNAT